MSSRRGARVGQAARRAGQAVKARWRRLRHPAGWYDEVNEVYGRHEGPDGTKAAGTVGLGGHNAGGAG